MKYLARFTTLLALFLFAGATGAQVSDRDQGIDLYREGKFADAIEVLEKRVASNEGDRAAWLYLGGAYVHADDEVKARNAFGKFRMKPTTPQPKYDSSVKITSKPRPRYSEEARRNMSSGTVTVAIEFRSDGTIGFVFPIQPLPRDLIGPALDAAKGIRFEPAIKSGKPVTVINFAEYGFRTS
jgi:hypothetical protein